MASDNPYQSSVVSDGSASIRRAPWLTRLLIAGAGGIALLFGGFLYGVAMVGVPSQDPTPEMARREAFHLGVSGWGAAIGGCILLLSVIGIAGVLLFRTTTRPRK